MMDSQSYTAANLSDNLVDELKTIEDKLSEKANKKVVVIAYEKENQDKLD
ncbi:hypothetical protein [Neobacillus terrae]|nr:hypothetical protein [Neobacillus terrae]NHM30780.1 hypothetical protein [Neobacillus terrae]